MPHILGKRFALTAILYKSGYWNQRGTNVLCRNSQLAITVAIR